MESILAFGDSNTWGLIPGSSPQTRYPEHVRWTGLLQRRLSKARILEEGLCGRTTVFEDKAREGRNGLKTLPEIAGRRYPFDSAIIMLGTNDCKSEYKASGQEIGQGIEKCLEELEKHVIKERILLISPIFLGEHVWQEDKDPEFDTESVEKSKTLKNVYEEIAKRRGVNFMAASDFVSADERDDEHLNEEGHRVFADAVYEKLLEMQSSCFNL